MLLHFSKLEIITPPAARVMGSGRRHSHSCVKKNTDDPRWFKLRIGSGIFDSAYQNKLYQYQINGLKTWCRQKQPRLYLHYLPGSKQRNSCSLFTNFFRWLWFVGSHHELRFQSSSVSKKTRIFCYHRRRMHLCTGFCHAK